MRGFGKKNFGKNREENASYLYIDVITKLKGRKDEMPTIDELNAEINSLKLVINELKNENNKKIEKIEKKISLINDIVNGIQINKWKFCNNGRLKYTGGTVIHADTKIGKDTGSLALAAGGSDKDERGAVINLYGENHNLSAGEIVFTPSASGRISCEEFTQSRHGLVVNAQFSQAPWEKELGWGKAIAVDINGQPWIINGLGEVCERKNKQFVKDPDAPKATDIAIGDNGDIWIIGPEKLYVKRVNQSQWEAVAGWGKAIAVGINGQPWLVASNGDVSERKNNQFVKDQYAPKATAIAIGNDGNIWIIGPDKTYVKRANQNQWEAVAGWGKAIAVGINGQPWLVASNGDVSERKNNQFGKDRYAPKATAIAIGNDGNIWITDQKKYTYWKKPNVYGIKEVAYPAKRENDANAGLHVFGDAKAGENPEIKGLKPIKEASIGVFEQKGGDWQGCNGISILTEEHTGKGVDSNGKKLEGRNEGRIAFGTSGNPGSGQVVYDHNDRSLKLIVDKTERIRINRDQATLELRRDGKRVGSLNINGSSMQVDFAESGVIITSGNTEPNHDVDARPGSLYLCSNGKNYVKTSGSGNIGWQEVITKETGFSWQKVFAFLTS